MWIEELQCDVNTVYFDCQTHIASIQLPPHHCADMTGAIAFCQRIDPDVSIIATECGSQPDTIYIREHGRWQATRRDAVRQPLPRLKIVQSTLRSDPRLPTVPPNRVIREGDVPPRR